MFQTKPSKKYAVIGNPIRHSLSPIIHQHFAKEVGITLTYNTLVGQDASFEQQIQNFFAQKGSGLNITAPFKQRAFALANQRSQSCQLARSANTLWINNQGHLCADNTDGLGLINDLFYYLDVVGKNILILGTGGATRGIIYPLLEQMPLSITVASRSKQSAMELQQHFPHILGVTLNELEGCFDLIINATPANTSAFFEVCTKDLVHRNTLCYDLSYNVRAPTAFVQYADSLDCKRVDGWGMLIEQAAESFYLWHGLRLSKDYLKKARTSLAEAIVS